jgi:ribonuclease-3
MNRSNKIFSKISKERRGKLTELQKNLGIRFKRIDLLNTALSHKSYVNEADCALENNEKLEFLGDAFLGLIISRYLYEQNLYFREGSLARIKSYVVSEPTLHRVGQEINIHDYLLIGKGEEKTGGRYRKALIGDTVEAVIGAYYLDNGYKPARRLVEKLFYKEILKVERNRHEKDYKSILQELAQKRFKTVPQYKVIHTEGPDHRRKFFVNVVIINENYGTGIGENNKQAEQKAAFMALHALKKVKRLKDSSIEELKDINLEHKNKGRKIVRSSKRSKNRSEHAET